jgi:Tol biopolymer transport system component
MQDGDYILDGEPLSRLPAPPVQPNKLYAEDTLMKQYTVEHESIPDDPRPSGRHIQKFLYFALPLFVLLVLTSCSRTVKRDSAVVHGNVPAGGYIAFIGTDGNIYTLNPRTGDVHGLTDDASSDARGRSEYRYPAWSFDGDTLAFLHYRTTDDGGIESTLYLSDPTGNRVQSLASSNEVLPFYLYWSPDNNRISFLGSMPQSSELLFGIIPAGGGEPSVVDRGQPFYWSWVMDGNAILTHSGGAAMEHPESAFIKLIDLTDQNGDERTLYYLPAHFQAPAHSPDGTRMLIAAEMYTGYSTLVLASAEGEPQELIVDWRGPLSFSWSPTGTKLAYIRGRLFPVGGMIGDLFIRDMTDGTEPPEYEVPAEMVLAYFWSPDGEKIAIFEPRIIPDPEEGRQFIIRLSVLDTNSGTIRHLTNLIPTRAFLGQIVPFFDQYQRSHTIWSPDSRYIVFNAITEDDEPGIFAVGIEDKATPVFMANGVFPFWSWN